MASSANPPIFDALDTVTAHVVEIRHTLHRHPELAYQETFASETVCQELDSLGISYNKGSAGGTGVVALIEGGGGGREGTSTQRCVALRADMDALPITEETGLPYASEKAGCMHACGHDGHMAILLGTAAILKAQVASFAGIVKLLFQPAEEGGCGADRMVKDGVLENPKVEAIFGLHGWPGLKVGTVATRGGPLLASVDGFTVRLRGRGGHAAAPHDSIDPIICGAAVLQALQTVVSRESEPTDPCVLTVSQINGGTAFNVIPDYVEFSGTIRALSKKRREAALAALERVTRGIAAAHRCEAKFDYFGATPVTMNAPELAAFVGETARRVLGPRAYSEADKPSMWGEDFAFFQEHVPGCFFMLGVQPPERKTYPMLHNPAYDFTDAAIPVGIRMMTELALGWLAREG